MLPRKNVPMANVTAHHEGLTHASHPTLPIKRHMDALSLMQQVTSLYTRPHLDSSRSPRVSILPWKNLPMANVAAHPGGSTMPLARRCPSKGTRMPSPHATSAFPMHSTLSQLIEEPPNPKTSMLPQKNVLMANVMAHPRDSSMPPTRFCPLKGTWMSLLLCNECPSSMLGPILSRRRALKSSREHVASEKHVNGQHRTSP